MPKRHRQPEPIDIVAAGNAKPAGKAALPALGHDKTGKTSDGNASGVKRANTGGSLASESPSEAVFPATPSTLATDRKARLKATRAATAAMEDYGDATVSDEGGDSVPSTSASGEVDFDSSDLGDDGNQEDDDVADLLEEDSDRDGGYEAFLGGGGSGKGKRKKGHGSSRSSSDDDDDTFQSDEESEGDAMMYHGGGTDSDDDDSEPGSEEEGEDSDDGGDQTNTVSRRTRLHRLANSDDGERLGGVHEEGDSDDDDDGDDATGGEGRQVTVDFGVYDMRKGHIDAVVHLMDQLCPDKMDEINRDDLGEALAENPYTYIVRVNDAEDDDAEDATAEVYGLASVLDVAHGVQTHPAAFKPLHKLLRNEVWRTVSPGIPPADLLLSTTTSTTATAAEEEEEEGGEDEERRARKKGKKELDGEEAMQVPGREGGADLAKCLLLVSEYIRNVPIELTVQILDDLVSRVEEDATRKEGGPVASSEDPEESKRASAVRATPGCMFAVLAKVQRMVDPPVTLSDAKGKKKRSDEGVSASPRKRHGGAGSTEEAALDLSRYAFWREEDNVLFDFRDKRVAAVSYRCRPQYEGQPEQDIPLSLLFVLQHGALRQAVAEMKRRATIATDITRY